MVSSAKTRESASTHKKVVVLLLDGATLKGYLNPSLLGRMETVDLLSLKGEHESVEMKEIKSVYFVREFDSPFELERRTFLSRPKLGGLWVSLRFRDEDTMEGIVSNNLLDMLDTGVQLTPPDVHGNTLRMFIPRTALAEMKVLGVVGATKRPAHAVRGGQAAAEGQTKLFGE